MEFVDSVIDTVTKRLQSIPDLNQIITKIKRATEYGRVAFYPCSRLTRLIVEEVATRCPELLPQLIAYDRSPDAKLPHISVMELHQLAQNATGTSLLVLAANTFSKKEKEAIRCEASYLGDMFVVTKFELSCCETVDLPRQIREVHSLLADQRSKAVYLTYWLSRIMDDESPLSLFSQKLPELPLVEGNTVYKGYVIFGLDNTECRLELQGEIYRMPNVHPKPGHNVLDVGGFKGDTAVYFADQIGSTGKVYVFEPVAANFKDLERTVASNGLGERITLINKGCSDHETVLSALTNAKGAPWSFFDVLGNERVEITTIDSYVEGNSLGRVDFIKMDVEGLEMKVISGAEKTIRQFVPEIVIPLYHEAVDLIAIPLRMKEFELYDLFVDCKIDGPFGINLFCSPKNKS